MAEASFSPTSNPPAAPRVAGSGEPRPRGSRSLFAGLLRTARPKQWAKNVLVFAAPGAAGVLGEGPVLVRSGLAFVSFCLVASGTYFLNDARDIEADRAHPQKQHRPVAAGVIPLWLAVGGGVALLLCGFAVSALVDWRFLSVVATYVAITTAYTLWLKNIPVVDLAGVASGFIVRAVAGGVAAAVPISEWFLIVAASGSLFVVTGKRHVELLELGDDATDHRPSLAHYSRGYLAYVRAVASSIAILAYCLWAFEKSALVGNEMWFQLSIIPFVLGILRYALLLDQGKGGAPEELVLADRMLQVLGLAWAVLFGIAVHGG